MFERNLLKTAIVACAAVIWCAGCGDHGWPKPQKQQAPKTTTTQSDDNGVNYCPERAQLVKEADNLYRDGDKAFNKWGSTRADADVAKAKKMLDKSFDKYVEAKNKYGSDDALARKMRRNTKLRMRVYKSKGI